MRPSGERSTPNGEDGVAIRFTTLRAATATTARPGAWAAAGAGGGGPPRPRAGGGWGAPPGPGAALGGPRHGDEEALAVLRQLEAARAAADLDAADRLRFG